MCTQGRESRPVQSSSDGNEPESDTTPGGLVDTAQVGHENNQPITEAPVPIRICSTDLKVHAARMCVHQIVYYCGAME